MLLLLKNSLLTFHFPLQILPTLTSHQKHRRQLSKFLLYQQCSRIRRSAQNVILKTCWFRNMNNKLHWNKKSSLYTVTWSSNYNQLKILVSRDFFYGSKIVFTHKTNFFSTRTPPEYIWTNSSVRFILSESSYQIVPGGLSVCLFVTLSCSVALDKSLKQASYVQYHLFASLLINLISWMSRYSLKFCDNDCLTHYINCLAFAPL